MLTERIYYANQPSKIMVLKVKDGTWSGTEGKTPIRTCDSGGQRTDCNSCQGQETIRYFPGRHSCGAWR